MSLRIDQNRSFSANWICREVVVVPEINPTEGLILVPEKIVAFGLRKLARFRRLKTSARNCKLNLSLMVNFLNNEVSSVAKPGANNEPRDTFPMVPASGNEKAQGSK